MSPARPLTVLVVGDEPCPTAAGLLDRPDVAEGTAEPTAALGDADCVVACGSSVPTDVATTASEQSVPVVACECDETQSASNEDRTTSDEDRTTSEPSTAADDDRTTGERRLYDSVRDAVGDASPTESRLARLHTGSAELVGLTDRDQLFDRVVEIATDVLEFDVGAVFAAADDGFRRVVGAPTAAVPERLDPDHGLTAESHRTGNSVRVDDIRGHPVAESATRRYRSGLGVPFGERYVFEALSAEPGAYDDRDLELAELLCDHAAQAAARLDAESDLQRREATVTALHRAAPRLIDADDAASLFERTVDIAEQVLEFDRSYLLVARDGGDRFVRVAGNDDDISTADPDQGVLGKTYETGEPYLVRDADADPDARPAHETTKSAISVPVGDVGVFQALSTEPAAFDETDLELAELLMSYASATRDRIRSEAALRSSRRTVERLHAAAADIAAAETEADLLAAAMDAVEDVLAFDKSTITLLDGEMLVPAADSADSPPDASRPMHVSEGFGGKTLRNGESYRVDSMAADPDADPVREDYRSGISVPIGDAGVFQAASSEEAAFDDDDVELAELLMTHVAVSLERVRADADRREERNRLKALFENIPGAALSYELVDGEPHVREVNEAFERTFGYDAETVTGESIDDFIVPSDHAAEAGEYNGRLERGERIQAEVERRTADGPRHFLLQVIPLEVGEENSRGFAIYSDVTEQKRREEELRRQNERLDQFASVVSHDLRNPLNVANGYLQLARETGDEAQFDRVEGALDRMDELITDLLVLAREGRDVGDTESVALGGVARQAWANVPTDDAVLDVATDREVDADADRLVELFENLFRNAVEHGVPDDASDRVVGDDGSRPVDRNQRAAGPRADPVAASRESAGGSDAERGGAGGSRDVGDGDRDGPRRDATLTVTVGDRTAGEPGFYVADDGAGIDASFDPFETGATTSEDGTGFGLAIVRSVAEAHGWSVDAGESEAGGARFDFVL